jgi:hypothetical protein
MTVDPNVQTTAFLRRLERALAPLDAAERAEILAELSSHLADRAEQGPDRLSAALAIMGEPSEYARRYLEDHQLADALQRVAPGLALISILGRAGRSALAFAVGLGVVTLYCLGLSFLAMAILKPLAPANIGLWAGAEFHFGFLARPPATPEALGLWMIPLCGLGAVLCYVAGTALVRRGGRMLLKRRPD